MPIKFDDLKAVAAAPKKAIVNFHGVKIEVKRCLSWAEMLAFVNAVANYVFSDNGEYQPAWRNIAEKTALLNLYAGVEPSNDTADMYDLLYSYGELYSAVKAIVNEEQFAEIKAAIDCEIKQRIRRNELSYERKREEFFAQVKEFEEKAKQTFDVFEKLNLSDLVKSLGEIDDKTIAQAVANSLKKINKKEAGQNHERLGYISKPHGSSRRE